MPTADGTSKYVAVREHLLRRVQGMEQGDRLPAEPALCDEYGVSRITLRHAVDGLITEGWLVREHGRGTFVSSPQFRTRYRERFAGEVSGFHTQQADEGRAVTTSVLSHRVRAATAAVASHLAIAPADPVFDLVRLRFVDGQLHHLATTQLPIGLYPGIDTIDFSDQSLFAVLRTRYGRVLERNDLIVTIVAANPAVSEALGVPLGDKLLTLTSTVSDPTGTPLAYGSSHFTPRNSELAFGLHA